MSIDTSKYTAFTNEQLKEQMDRNSKSFKEYEATEKGKEHIKKVLEMQSNDLDINSGLRKMINKYGTESNIPRPTMTIEKARRLLWDVIRYFEISKGIKFNWDNDFKDLIRNMLLYFLGSQESIFNISRGIYLYGDVGRRKTTIMDIFSRFTEITTYKAFKVVSSKEIVYEVSRQSNTGVIKQYFYNSWCFDDFAHENQYKLWGNDVDVMEEILCRRYDNNSLTHVTTNLKPEHLHDRYRSRLNSRAYEMFNFVEVAGPDYRVVNAKANKRHG